MGIFQGIAEFLPISSSGHLILLHRMFGMEEPALTFDIVVHVASLIAILVVFWPDVWALIKNPFCKMTGLLIVGTIPVVVAGFIFRDSIEYLQTGIWLTAAFTVTGFLLVFADRFTAGTKEERDITYVDALIVGIMQAMALPPGISRSGTTIAGALSRGINREAAAKFSFLLAIVAITGAGVLESIQVARGAVEPAGIGLAQMIAGFVASLIVSYFSIRLLLRLIKACKLKYFAYYVWALAALILLDVVIINRFF